MGLVENFLSGSVSRSIWLGLKMVKALKPDSRTNSVLVLSVSPSYPFREVAKEMHLETSFGGSGLEAHQVEGYKEAVSVQGACVCLEILGHFFQRRALGFSLEACLVRQCIP